MIRFRYILAAVLAATAVIIFVIPKDPVQKETPSGPVKERSEEPEKQTVLTPTDSLMMRYDTVLTALIEEGKMVGSAAIITINGEIEYLNCNGVKKVGTTDSVDAHTIFRLASVSKPLSGMLAGILAEERMIGLDDRVVEYLPGFRLKDTANTNNLTIRNILSHTSGLVPHAYDNLVEAQVPFSVIMDSLYRVNISDVPGKLYGYQNVMFSLYDTIVRIRTGQSFGDLIDEKLFGPTGMHDASVGYEAFAGNSNHARPHVRTRTGYVDVQLNDRYYNTNPAAGINASISDLGQFMAALTSPDPHLIHPSAIDSVLSPQVLSPLRWIYLRRWGPVESKHYGLGWRIIGYKGRTVAYHGGYVRGYRAEIAVCREEGIGIAFLTNSPGRVGSEVVPAFLDMWLEESGEAVGGGQWAVGSRRSTVSSRQSAVGGQQSAVGGQQSAVGSRQSAVNSQQ